MSTTTTAQEANTTTTTAPAAGAAIITSATGATDAGPATLTTGQASQPAEFGDLASLPAWAQAEIKDLRRENTKRRKEQQDKEAEQRTQEETRLQESAQWQQLAEQRQARIADLETVAAAYETLSQEIAAGIETEIAAWPEEIKTLRPAGDSVADLMKWAKAARPLAQKLTAPQQPPAAPGQAPAPRPAGSSSADNRQRAGAALARTRSTF